MDCKADYCWDWEQLIPELIRLLTALSETLENWEDGGSEATYTFRAAIIWIFYEIMAAEVKVVLWLKSLAKMES